MATEGEDRSRSVARPQVVLVAYHSALWIRVAIGSFLAQRPGETILVVDNNPRRADLAWETACEEERQWLSAHPHVRLIDNEADDRTHGAGLDRALAWCRAQGVATMLHIEPDCYVTGLEWYSNLTAAIEGGAWMAACVRKPWGPLHPCPSIWRVDEVRASFRRQDGTVDATHPRFTELVDVERYRLESGVDARTQRWSWDTGLKAWFEAAVAHRAAAVSGRGFRHYWCGSQTRREHLDLFLDPRLVRYTRPTIRRWTHVVGRQVAQRIRQDGISATIGAAATRVRLAIASRLPHRA